MKLSPVRFFPILLAMILLLAVVLTAADPEGFAMYTGADLKKRLDAAKMDEHKVRQDRTNWGNHGLLVIRREGDGEGEVHETQVDVIFVRSGEGTLILGGTMVEPRTIAPNEIRAKSITGGISKKMAPGDVFHIPAKLPHQMLVPKTLSFEVVKVDIK
jgi:mannose-6-phosphate isomerase-like protein (cupin superfamily)